MGFYISKLPTGDFKDEKDRFGELIRMDGARAINRPFDLDMWIPDMICCVMNPTFEAAAYAFDAIEMLRFSLDDTGRPQRWLVVPGAAQMAGYKYYGDPIRKLNGQPVPTDTRNPDFDD